MTITYLIELDANDDGNFSDIGEELTVDVLHVEWRLGMSEPYARVSDVAEALITLRNHDRMYSPDVSDTVFGKSLRIRSDDGNSIRTHFTGFVREVVPQAGEHGQQLTQLVVYGREHELEQVDVRLPLMVNIRADEVLDSLLAQVPWRYAVLDGHCIIGRDSIGSSDIFPDERISTSLETGKSTFAYVGDDWGDGLPALQAIQAMVDAEGGRFLFNREGEAQFINRHYLLNNPATSADFDDDMTALVYGYGDVTNHIEVTLTPRSVGAKGAVLWQSEHPITVVSGSRVRIVARYEQEDEPIGAVDVIAPIAELDYEAYTSNLQAVTQRINIWLVETGMSASVLDIDNPLAADITVTQLQLRGTPLISQNPQTYITDDPTSIALYGYQSKTLSFPAFSDVDDALGILAWELQRLSSPRGTVRELQTNRRNHPTEALSLTVLDLITVTETQTGHSDTYLIIAEHHEVDKGGTRHRVSWLLEPAETGYFFIIGTHSIGDADVIMALR